ASCLRLLLHDMRVDASRIFWTAGNKSAMRMPMMAITTNNSMSVKPDPFRPVLRAIIRDSCAEEEGEEQKRRPLGGHFRRSPGLRRHFQVVSAGFGIRQPLFLKGRLGGVAVLFTDKPFGIRRICRVAD